MVFFIYRKVHPTQDAPTTREEKHSIMSAMTKHSATKKAVTILHADLQYLLQNVQMSSICVTGKGRSYPKTSENV